MKIIILLGLLCACFGADAWAGGCGDPRARNCNPGFVLYNDPTGQGQCLPCPSNSVANGCTQGLASCTPCDQGTIPNADNSSCITIPDGCGDPRAQNCNPGYYLYDDPKGREQCLPCTGNTVANGCTQGLASCTPCGIGTVPDSLHGACVACPPGQVPNASQTHCVCPKGTVIDFVHDVCVACPSGKEPNSNQTACVCPSGQQNPSGACLVQCAKGKCAYTKQLCNPDGSCACYDTATIQWYQTNCGGTADPNLNCDGETGQVVTCANNCSEGLCQHAEPLPLICKSKGNPYWGLSKCVNGPIPFR